MLLGSGTDVSKRLAHLRWWMIGAGTILVAAGHLFQLVQASFPAIGLATALALTAHVAVAAITRSGTAQPWPGLAVATLDLVTAALLILFFGPGSLAIVLVAAGLPHLTSRSVGYRGLLTLVAGAAYLVAATLHRQLYTEAGAVWWMPSTAVLLDTALIAVAMWFLAHMSTGLGGRIQEMLRILITLS